MRPAMGGAIGRSVALGVVVLAHCRSDRAPDRWMATRGRGERSGQGVVEDKEYDTPGGTSAERAHLAVHCAA